MALLIASGIVAAAQIGKAIISIRMIRADMSLGLGIAGLIVATFATLGGFFGLGAGVVVRRFGARPSLICGMASLTLGGLIGAAAPNESILVTARIIEGAGFFGVVLAIPSILAHIVDRDERDFLMALWSAYMPAGIMLMLLTAPLLPVIGWRNLWIANAALTGTCGTLLAIWAPRLRETLLPDLTDDLLREVVRIVRNTNCLLLAFSFFTFSCLMFSLAFALPSLLTSINGVGLGMAGVASALVLTMSASETFHRAFYCVQGCPSGPTSRPPLWGSLYPVSRSMPPIYHRRRSRSLRPWHSVWVASPPARYTPPPRGPRPDRRPYRRRLGWSSRLATLANSLDL